MAGQTWLDEIRAAARRNTLRRLEDAKLDKAEVTAVVEEAVEVPEAVVVAEPVKKAKK